MTDSPKLKPSQVAEVTTSSKNELRVPLHDPVPTLFADGCHTANIIAGCVRLDLFVEHAWAGSKGTQPLVAGRIVIPLERIEAFARGVNALVKKLKDDKAARDTKMAEKV